MKKRIKRFSELWLINRINYCEQDIHHRKAELKALKNIELILKLNKIKSQPLKVKRKGWVDIIFD